MCEPINAPGPALRSRLSLTSRQFRPAEFERAWGTLRKPVVLPRVRGSLNLRRCLSLRILQIEVVQPARGTGRVREIQSPRLIGVVQLVCGPLTSPANAALPPVNTSTAAETATTTSRFIPVGSFVDRRSSSGLRGETTGIARRDPPEALESAPTIQLGQIRGSGRPTVTARPPSSAGRGPWLATRRARPAQSARHRG
jgi:hypothetical protein